MAVKKIQKNRMNDSGTFDVIHYETDASQVLMEDGTTAEAAISGKEPAGAAAQALANAKSYTDTQIAGIPTPDVSGQINTHNTDANAHSGLFETKADLVDGKVPYSELPADLVSAIDEVAAHVSDATIHVTAEEKQAWNDSMLLKSVTAALSAPVAWSSVTYGNGTFVAVAVLSNRVAYSNDGITWTQTTMPINASWESVTYGNGKFVAVTYNNNKAAYSEDGINWTQTTMPTSAYWESVTYGNGKFVAVAFNSDIVAYSNDGINWTKTTMPASTSWYPVTYGNGKFVAVARLSNEAAYSNDGINWTQTTMPASTDWLSVTYGNGKFVAVAYNKNIAAYSDDGINWTQTTMPTSANWLSVTYGNDKFVAVANSSNIAAYSNDGINWTQATLPTSAKWQSVTYGNDKFVAVVMDSIIAAYSEDGINWAREQNVAVETVSGVDVTKDVKKILGLDNVVAIPTKSVTITLTSSGWDSTALTQTVTVSGVLADEAKQMIQPVPAMASQAAYIEAGILCTSQAVDSLTFTAKTAPTENLTVYVTIQEVVQG